MAQAPDTDSPKRKRKGASVVVWLLMAMLVTGLGGFGITNYGGGATAIGTVGARDISVTQYARALQSEVNAFSAQMGTQIPLQDALNIGLDQQVRQKLVTTTALDGEADRVGLSVGDARVAEEITANTAFRGASGTFDRETYRFTLRNNNLTEAEFEGALRDDLLELAATQCYSWHDVAGRTLQAYDEAAPRRRASGSDRPGSPHSTRSRQQRRRRAFPWQHQRRRSWRAAKDQRQRPTTRHCQRPHRPARNENFHTDCR